MTVEITYRNIQTKKERIICDIFDNISNAYHCAQVNRGEHEYTAHIVILKDGIR